MNQVILDFINKERLCGLAINVDSKPHNATMHYSFNPEKNEFYFSTDKGSRKCKDLLENKTQNAAMTIGFSEQEWITVQLEGNIHMVNDPEELKLAKSFHYAKHPNSQKFENDPSCVFLVFKPNWIRYTDFNTMPETVVEENL
jgi:uncharacterized protein YhbP (UPF0306 family)